MEGNARQQDLDVAAELVVDQEGVGPPASWRRNSDSSANAGDLKSHTPAVRITNDANRPQRRNSQRSYLYRLQVAAKRLVLSSYVDHLYVRSVDERVSDKRLEQIHVVSAFDQQEPVGTNLKLGPAGCGTYRRYVISKLRSRPPSSVSPVNVTASTLPVAPFLNSLCMDSSSGASA